MRLRSMMTMAFACAASAAALAAAGPATANAAAASGTSGGAPGDAAPPLLVRPHSGASYQWGVATPVPGLAALDDNGTGQLSAVSCAAAGACSAGGFYTDGSTKLTQAFVVGEAGGTWKAAQGLLSVATGLNTGGSAGVAAVSCAAAGNCGATGFFQSGGATHPFVAAESGSVWDGAIAVPGTGTDDSGSLAESCPVPQRCSIGGYVPAGSGREVGFLDGQLPSRDWDAALPLPGTLGDLAPADSAAKDATLAVVSCVSAGNCSAAGSFEQIGDISQVWVASQHNGSWGVAGTVSQLVNLNVGGISDVTGLSCAAG